MSKRVNKRVSLQKSTLVKGTKNFRPILRLDAQTLIRNLLGSHGYTSSRVLDIPFDVDDVANAPPNSVEVGLNPILTSRLHQMKWSEGEVKEMGRKIRDIVGLNQVSLRFSAWEGARDENLEKKLNWN